MDDTESSKYYISGKAGYAVTKNIEFGVSVSYYQGAFNFNGFETNAYSSYNVGGTWSSPNSPGTSMFQNRAWQWPKDFRINVAPYLNMQFGDFDLRAIYYYTGQANTLYGWTNQAETAMFDRGKESIHQEQSNGFYLYPSYKFNSWNKLSAVIHYRFDEYDAYKRRIAAYASGTPTYQTSWFQTALMTAHYIDIAVEDEFKFKTNYSNVKFSLGLSYDAQELSVTMEADTCPARPLKTSLDYSGRG